MATKRRTLKTPPQESVSRLFKTVPQYLNWIISTSENNEDNEKKIFLGKATITKQLASRLLIKTRSLDSLFKHFFLMPDGFPKRDAVKNLITYNKPDVYTLNLPIVHNGPLRTFQIQAGPKHGVPHGEALMQLHNNMTKEQRSIQRHVLKKLLDENDYFSPRRIGAWLSPLFREAIESVNNTETKHYFVAAKRVSNDGLGVIFTCTPKDEGREVFTIYLKIEVLLRHNELPWNYKFRSPFPKQSGLPDVPGKELQNEIRQGFDKFKYHIYLYSPIYKYESLPDISVLPTRAKNYLEYRLKQSGTAFTSKSLPESFSKFILGHNRGDPRAWKIDFVDIERLTVKRVKSEPRFVKITKALNLYDLIATGGNKVLPKLNQRTTRSVSLWLFKQGERRIEGLLDAFYAILEILSACLDNGFCPTFCQPQENTLDADIAEEENWKRQIKIPRDRYEMHDLGEDTLNVDEDLDETESIPGPAKPNTVEQLMRIIQENNVRNAVHYINIC